MVLDSKYVVILYQPTLHISPAPMYLYVHCLFRLLFLSIIMRPSSLRGGLILRRTLSVCPSVCPSVPLSDVEPSYERTSKIEKLRFTRYRASRRAT